MSKRRDRRVWGALGAVAGAVVLFGCGSAQEADVQDAAGRFYAALEAEDGQAACAVLAARTRDAVESAAEKPCAEAILEEDVPQPGAIDQVGAFGTAAQIRYASDTAFLTRFKHGWRVVAVGCLPVPGDRYDCQVEAG